MRLTPKRDAQVAVGTPQKSKALTVPVVTSYQKTQQQKATNPWGFTNKELNFIKNAKGKGFSLEQTKAFIDKKRTEEKVWQEAFDKVQQPVKNILWGAIGWLAEVWPNLAWMVGQQAGVWPFRSYMDKKGVELKPNALERNQEGWQQVKSMFYDKAWVQEDAATTKVWEFWSQALATGVAGKAMWVTKLWAWLQWAADAAIFWGVSKWEIKPLEVAGGYVAGKVIGKLTEKLPKVIEKSDDVLKNSKVAKLWKRIQPKFTPSVRQEYSAKWLEAKTWLLWKTTYLPDQQDLNVMNTVAKDLKLTNSRTKNIQKVIKAIDTEEAALIKAAEGEWEGMVNMEIVANKIDNLEKPLMLKSDRTLNNAYDEVKEQFIKILWKNEKNASWVLKARKEFDNLVGQEFPNLYTSDKLTPMKKAIIDIRWVANQLLDDMLDWTAKSSLAKQSSLIRIKENLSTFAEELWNNSLKKAYKWSILKSLIWAWGTAWAGYLVWKAIWGGNDK